MLISRNLHFVCCVLCFVLQQVTEQQYKSVFLPAVTASLQMFTSLATARFCVLDTLCHVYVYALHHWQICFYKVSFLKLPLYLVSPLLGLWPSVTRDTRLFFLFLLCQKIYFNYYILPCCKFQNLNPINCSAVLYWKMIDQEMFTRSCWGLHKRSIVTGGRCTWASL